MSFLKLNHYQKLINIDKNVLLSLKSKANYEANVLVECELEEILDRCQTITISQSNKILQPYEDMYKNLIDILKCHGENDNGEENFNILQQIINIEILNIYKSKLKEKLYEHYHIQFEFIDKIYSRNYSSSPFNKIKIKRKDSLLDRLRGLYRSNSHV